MAATEARPAIRAGHCSARRQVGRRGVLPVIPELDVVLELVPGLLDGTLLAADPGVPKGTAALRMRDHPPFRKYLIRSH